MALRDGMTDVSGNAKKGDMSAFDDAVKKVADAVIKLTEAASQVGCGVALCTIKYDRGCLGL